MKPNTSTLLWPSRLRALWPNAAEIRYAGWCDVCKRPSLWSFTESQWDMPRQDARGTMLEGCGFWCERCGFSNAGLRRVEEGE